MADLRFDGRVAVVTGAGAGLGRAYALLLASRGAKVVVNDLGGSMHGDGGASANAADTVVAEIRKNGGIAVPNYDSVVDGEKIIMTALDNFGRVDILINNAGILRDRSFARISDQDWDLVHNVHLKGSFKTTQAAFPHFKKQGYGRIVMTTSNSGLYGNFGQANYSSAKMGLVGLASTVAIEGASNNVFCNVIVPTAASRLTKDILPPEIFAELKPELIAPVVAYLCHEICQENGTIIESAAGWAGKTHLIRALGARLRSTPSDAVTVETVHQNWAKINDMNAAKRFDAIGEITVDLVNSLEPNNNRLEEAPLSGADNNLYTFNHNNVILYNLAVGASTAHVNDLKYLYENDEDFGALPTFYVLPAMQAIFKQVDMSRAVAGKELSLAQMLHAEQHIEFLTDKIPVEGVLRSEAKIVEVLDKGSGAVIACNVETFNEQNELIIRNQLVTFAVGGGNFGGSRSGSQLVAIQPPPNRQPDTSRTYRTSADQAALYRLCGDSNPLHIDPAMAQVVGFKQPILHGLCSYGISVKLVLEAYANNDAAQFKACKARFSRPVLPGQTLRVDMWRVGNRIHFETHIQDGGNDTKPVISGAYVDLKMVSGAQQNNGSASEDLLQCEAIFEFIQDQIKEDPKKATVIGGVYQFNITEKGKTVKQWTMDLKNAKIYVGEPKDKPTTTLLMSAEDFVKIAQGKLQPQAAFMQGKMKVTGNIMMAQKLGTILRANVAKL